MSLHRREGKAGMTLEERVVEYLRTVEDATPRQVAKAVGESRYHVKRALERLTARGILDHDLPLMVPEAVLRVLFNGAKPPKMARPTDAVRPADAPSAVHTEVRRI